jgi:hypothetical protein
MSLPRVFDVPEFVAFWPGSSRHSEVQGEPEETCNERDDLARKRVARKKLISTEAMMRS